MTDANDTTRPYLVRAQQIQQQSDRFSHPWNPRSELYGVQLSRATGMKSAGISHVTIPPDRESFVYHIHYREDEWIYVLSGCGIAIINDEEYEVGPGDFMGFPAGEVAHHMRNPFDAPLVYLMGGDNRDFDVADFPHLGRRMIRRGTDVDIYDLADTKKFE